MDIIVINPKTLKVMSTFSNTMSIAEFARVNSLSSLEVKKNPKTGKFFGVDSTGRTYRVGESLNGIITMDCQVSLFTPEDGGEASYMIHKRGEGAPTVSSLTFGVPAPKNAEDAI
jgi:hypothetical protein